MIERAQGNLLDADVEALVNTVNCVGVMGKGVALLLKQAYPQNYERYRQACKAGEVQPGRMLTVQTGRFDNPRHIINFPTKRHWKAHSRIGDIRAGLPALVKEVRRLGITSVAVPALGCGSGGLDWSEVRPLIVEAFAPLPHVRVLLFEPAGPEQGTAAADDDGGSETLTRPQALLLRLMKQYCEPGYRLTMREVQQLAYFLQAAGEPLSLRCIQDMDGPVTADLIAVVQPLSGSWIRGLDPSRPDAEIELLPGAAEAVEGVLTDPTTLSRGDRAARLIEGFETPYGLELLAAVHRAAQHRPAAGADPEVAIGAVHDWSDRQRRLMKAEHIRTAWHRLREHGWLPSAEPVTARTV